MVIRGSVAGGAGDDGGAISQPVPSSKHKASTTQEKCLGKSVSPPVIPPLMRIIEFFSDDT